MPESARSWRRLLRAFHRDAGYLVVGLTFVYAASGLAVNHVADWDPNFVRGERTVSLAGRLPASAGDAPSRAAAVDAALGVLDVGTPPDAVHWFGDREAEILWPHGTAYLDLGAAEVRYEWQAPRPLLRAANFLHLNRGKKAWTHVADAYAVLLLALATSGLWMLPGRRQRLRKILLVTAGAAVPVAYVLFADGPDRPRAPAAVGGPGALPTSAP